MDAGGLAQMAYNNFHQPSAPSYGSRGKGSHLRNISVPASNNLSAPGPDNQQVPTPRTARSALLAGLRTAPKTPNPTPTSAPPQQFDNGRYAPTSAYGQGHNGLQQSESLPTPPSSSSPAIQVTNETIEEYDQETYAQMQMMMAQNAYFAHVQQQLAAAQKVQQLQQQLAQLQMQSGVGYTGTPPMSPGMGMGNIASMYNNPAYAQYGQYQQQQYVQASQGFNGYNNAPQQQQNQQLPIAQLEVSPPTPIEQPPSAGLSMSASRANSRSRSPPKLNLQQSNASASNSSAAAGFRRGHRKASSLSTCTNINNIAIADAPKTSLPKLSQLPSTPLTATFGPGHASGTHPVRQPRGPPSIDELKAKPTSKEEGSKNFATRQRRRAISRLVSAGIERRSARSTPGSTSVGGAMTPVSENEGFAFDETESIGSAGSAMTGRQSRQSLRDGDNNSSADEGSVASHRSGKPAASLQVFSATDKRKSALF